MRVPMLKPLSRLIAVSLCLTSVFSPVSYAQLAFLPEAGRMVNMTQPFNSTVIKGVKVYPDNPFKFDFVVSLGDENLSDAAIAIESKKMISYFLASLTMPEKEMWVNLSPYENSRIIPASFGQTEMGKVVLAQDYMLKQMMATALYPENELGKEFWQKIYAEAQSKFGTTNMPVNTFNKVWILPNTAVVYENSKENTVFVVESSLKVMLEQDYLAANTNKAVQQFGMGQEELSALSQKGNAVSALSSQMIKEIVIPALEKEVNEGKNFAALRQVYQGLILASWYKKNLKDSILSKGYVNRGKVMGVNVEDKDITKKIYEQYLAAYRKGVYSYIKEEADPASGRIVPRKYFSGGFTAQRMPDLAQASASQQVKLEGDMAQLSAAKKLLFVGALLTAVSAGVPTAAQAQNAPAPGLETIEVSIPASPRGIDQTVLDAARAAGVTLSRADIMRVGQNGGVRVNGRVILRGGTLPAGTAIVTLTRGVSPMNLDVPQPSASVPVAPAAVAPPQPATPPAVAVPPAAANTQTSMPSSLADMTSDIMNSGVDSSLKQRLLADVSRADNLRGNARTALLTRVWNDLNQEKERMRIAAAQAQSQSGAVSVPAGPPDPPQGGVQRGNANLGPVTVEQMNTVAGLLRARPIPLANAPRALPSNVQRGSDGRYVVDRPANGFPETAGGRLFNPTANANLGEILKLYRIYVDTPIRNLIILSPQETERYDGQINTAAGSVLASRLNRNAALPGTFTGTVTIYGLDGPQRITFTAILQPNGPGFNVVAQARPAADRAQSSVGGIDLENVTLDARRDGAGVTSAFSNPEMLKMIQKADGLRPVIYGITPAAQPVINLLLGMQGKYSNAPQAGQA